MAGQILINYEAVYSKTAELKNHINNDLLTQIESEYGQIQSMLDNVDGAANANLKREMEENRKKSVIVAQTLDKLLTFMANSAKGFEQKEKEIAGVLASGVDKMKGGMK